MTASYNTLTDTIDYLGTTSFSLSISPKQKFISLKRGDYLGVTSFQGNKIAHFSGSNFFEIQTIYKLIQLILKI